MSEHDKVNILMVDDQPAKLLTYESILAELGENLIKAGSGREALEHLLKTEIAIILMDVSMPELNGFELAEMIRQHPRYQRTAIIFVSAVHLTDLDQLRGYKHGAVDYIPVPVIPELLRAKVSVFAELYRKTLQLERLNRELEQRVAERTAELEASTVRLRESEESFRAIFESAGIGISVLNRDTKILKVNPTMQEMLGYSVAEMLNMEMAAWTYPDDLSSDSDLFQDVLAGRLDRYQVEKRYIRKGGELLWGWFTATAITDAAGQAQFVIGMLEDITERKLAEAQLRAGEERLKAALHEKEVLLKEIHYRVKNNLQIIASLLSLQSDQLKDPDDLVLFEDTQHRVKSMALIHESLYRTGDLARFNFARYIDSLCTDLLQSYGNSASHIRLHTELDELTFDVDTAVPCGLILNELLTNVLKYAFPDDHPGDIVIGLRADAGQVTLSVRDTVSVSPLTLIFATPNLWGCSWSRCSPNNWGGRSSSHATVARPSQSPSRMTLRLWFGKQMLCLQIPRLGDEPISTPAREQRFTCLDDTVVVVAGSAMDLDCYRLWADVACQRTHRIPGRKHDRWLIEGSAQGGREGTSARGDLKQILIEPRVVHQVKPFLAVVLAPGVLDTPTSGPAVDDIDPSKQHGMCHLGLAIHQAFRLSQREGCVVHRFIIK
jgi:PAS domain S-box-containing protein